MSGCRWRRLCRRHLGSSDRDTRPLQFPPRTGASDNTAACSFLGTEDLLDAFYTDSKLNTQLAKLAGQHANFVNSTVVQRLTTPIDQLSKADIDGQIQDLLDDLGDTSKDGMLSKVSDANDQIWQLLQQCNTDNFEATLGSLISGITLQLVLQNAAIEILAINGSFFYRQKDMLYYSTYVSKMTGRVGTAANEIGTTHIGAWNAMQLRKGCSRPRALRKLKRGWLRRKSSGSSKSQMSIDSVIRHRLALLAHIQPMALETYRRLVLERRA